MLFQQRLISRLLVSAGLCSGVWVMPVQTLHAASVMGSGIDANAADPSVRVQDNLFNSVNGTWLKNTEIPADKSTFGTFIQLRDQSDLRVKTLLDELATQTQTQTAPSDKASSEKAKAPQTVAQKVSLFYASYLDTDKIDALGAAPVQPLLAEIEALKTRAELSEFLGKAQGLLINTPVGVGVEADPKHPLANLTQTWQGGLGLPDRDYYLNTDNERFAKARAAYETYLTQIIEWAHLAPGQNAKQAAQRVMALEFKIAQAHWDKVDNRNPVKTYNPMTVKQLQGLAPELDWTLFFKAAQLKGIDTLSVSQPSEVAGIAKLTAEVPLADWRLYLQLRALDGLSSVLPKPVREASFAFHGTALSGAKEERPRWQKATAALNGALGEAVGQLYVERYFPASSKTRMESLVANLMAAYKESIDKLSWMTPATKAKAQEKLSQYSIKIGYPNHWRDYSPLQVVAGEAAGNEMRAATFLWNRTTAKLGQPVDRTEWHMTPQTVNAYYNPSANEIVFPAAILEPPFFNSQADDAVNYGGIGAVIGHEISHGFDDQGSQFDGTGALNNWWTPEDRQAFEALTTQLVNQYEAYVPLPGTHLNGKLTLGENIADLSGLQIAYKAYVRSLKGQPAPVMDGLTGEQRFFYGWAQVWRSKSRDERLLQRLTSDPHSPEPFRANGAAVNHDGFHQTFGTQPGDGMYKAPAERIRLW
jgi:putative endopeptidase